MKKTLKRESKLFEIVESDAFEVSVCFVFDFFFGVGEGVYTPLFTPDKVKLNTAGWHQLQL